LAVFADHFDLDVIDVRRDLERALIRGDIDNARRGGEEAHQDDQN
jgi:hypothetical protein